MDEYTIYVGENKRNLVGELLTALEAKNGIAAYIDFYNTERFHQSLDYSTPDDIYFYSSEAVA
jgi:putative transposase